MATGTCMRPAARVPGSCRSGFAGMADSLQRLSISAPTPPRLLSTPVQARRECMLTGKTANNGYTVTFSHKRNKKLQGVNLQWKRVYWPEGQRWVRLTICTRALKTIEKKGLQAMAREAGLDLASLPYVDASAARREFLAARGTPMPPMPKDKRAMKNPEKLAASTKKPLVGQYLPGGRIKFVRAE